MAGPRPVLLLNTAVDKGRDGGGPRMLGGHVCPRSLEERRNSEEGEQGEEQRRWGKVIIRHDTGGRRGGGGDRGAPLAPWGCA